MCLMGCVKHFGKAYHLLIHFGTSSPQARAEITAVAHRKRVTCDSCQQKLSKLIIDFCTLGIALPLAHNTSTMIVRGIGSRSTPWDCIKTEASGTARSEVSKTWERRERRWAPC